MEIMRDGPRMPQLVFSAQNKSRLKTCMHMIFDELFRDFRRARKLSKRSALIEFK
jgi:hypothetical protein